MPTGRAGRFGAPAPRFLGAGAEAFEVAFELHPRLDGASYRAKVPSLTITALPPIWAAIKLP